MVFGDSFLEVHQCQHRYLRIASSLIEPPPLRCGRILSHNIVFPQPANTSTVRTVGEVQGRRWHLHPKGVVPLLTVGQNPRLRPRRDAAARCAGHDGGRRATCSRNPHRLGVPGLTSGGRAALPRLPCWRQKTCTAVPPTRPTASLLPGSSPAPDCRWMAVRHSPVPSTRSAATARMSYVMSRSSENRRIA